ncbi:MAG: choice-of-anchor tandem repeat GloVer-containing protein [Candidatus Cybelea sp.]
MTRERDITRVIALIFASVVLASCSRGPGSALLPAGRPNGAAQVSQATRHLERSSFGRPRTGNGYKVIFRFDYADGAFPGAGLTDVDGLLYGTTFQGGTGNGTVFSVTTSGDERVLHSFTTVYDGKLPGTSLINVKGLLYGATSQGGADDEGTVFTITTSGRENVLYSFKGGTDGATPQAGLHYVNGMLYGTTVFGGLYNMGTVFSLTTGGKETVLHSFAGGADGAQPYAALTNVKGVLYGTTLYGGSGSGCASPSGTGCGTVFSITTAGTETVLHTFTNNGYDGVAPFAGLTDLKGLLYGTTVIGGTASSSGTVFTITTSGKENVLYSFKGGTDGAAPTGGLIDVKGTLYGTTSAGGAKKNYGTIFSITAEGNEKVLHSFKGGTGGEGPHGNLVATNSGTLYATTESGGSTYYCYGYGCGTIFKVSP